MLFFVTAIEILINLFIYYIHRIILLFNCLFFDRLIKYCAIVTLWVFFFLLFLRLLILPTQQYLVPSSVLSF